MNQELTDWRVPTLKNADGLLGRNEILKWGIWFWIDDWGITERTPCLKSFKAFLCFESFETDTSLNWEFLVS